MAEVHLQKSLAVWRTAEFKTVLKHELELLDITQLPLVQGMTQGSVPVDGSVEVMVLNTSETDDSVQAKVGVFYQSIIAGCSCSDDPSPTDLCNEHCELQLEINKSTAKTNISLIN